MDSRVYTQHLWQIKWIATPGLQQTDTLDSDGPRLSTHRLEELAG